MPNCATQGTVQGPAFAYPLRMAIDYHINERDELITLTVNGPVTSSDACARIDALLGDAKFNADLPQLVDLRNAELEGTAADLKEFEQFLLTRYRSRLNASVAVVVNTQWDEEACAQAFWLCCSLYRAELFDGWNQACKWLIKKEFTASLAELDVIGEALSDSNEALSDSNKALSDANTALSDSDNQTEHTQ